MDKPIPEAVAVTLHQDRAGCEWIIVTSKDHPGSESEVTPSDDPALFDLLKALTAAQQQGQAVAYSAPQPMQQGGGEAKWCEIHQHYKPCEHTAPPSAPVGVEGLIAEWKMLIAHPDTSTIMRATLENVVIRLQHTLAAQPGGPDNDR